MPNPVTIDETAIREEASVRTSSLAPAYCGWPPDLAGECRRRIRLLNQIRTDPRALAAAKVYLARDPVRFIQDWVWTHDPRPAGIGGMTTLPFVPFPRQVEFIQWLQERLERQEDGLCEKSREVGVTWLCVSFAVWMWLFVPGSAVGFGSRKESLVDRLGDPDSIFEKIRFVVDHLPAEFLPRGFQPKKHSLYMKLVNPENGATITGEAGDNIGRGGRKTIYFKDESAHYERPMKIEAALSQTTNVQIDVSSVNGPGNPFFEKRMTWPPERIFIFDWRDDPRKDEAWYERMKASKPAIVVAQEIDRDYGASIENVLIPGKWVQAALKLELPPSGAVIAGLDVADGGTDAHALVIRHGHTVLTVESWTQGGATEAARKAHTLAGAHVPQVDRIRYEKEGVGAAASGVARDLKKKRPRFEGVSPGSTRLPGWYIKPSPGDRGKKNADMFVNLKAKTWWLLRDRFQRTWEHVEGRKKHPPEALISLRPLIGQEHVSQLVAELSQPQYVVTESGKIKIRKTPKGYRSPNLADALMISYLEPPRTITGVW